jgi:hypothetical protein
MEEILSNKKVGFYWGITWTVVGCMSCGLKCLGRVRVEMGGRPKKNEREKRGECDLNWVTRGL